MRAAQSAQCYMVTGEADFVLIIVVEDVEAFDVFVKTSSIRVTKWTSTRCAEVSIPGRLLKPPLRVQHQIELFRLSKCAI
ncbi:Lrp/AsnC ligand binding domain-containing protein [Mesorhizobium sp. M0808]|uniref:Lrp/AsnC ligand binding domain-containing protein n=1 Tax=Mesorhizobium sp. M0808 TaxID=2957002 RepID=UPI003337EDB4